MPAYRAPVDAARALALGVPLALIGGALISQYGFGLYPCEMCHWQRWPHYAAIVLALVAFVPQAPQRQLVALAALAIAVSGAIGVFHAGVEYGWWQGITGCTTTVGASAGSTADLLKEIMAAPLIRCDQPQWTLWGVSLAGFNALFSLAAALAIAALLVKQERVG
jgi:disulfide bond formation protein DsbB